MVVAVDPRMRLGSARFLLNRYRGNPEAWGREVLGVRFSTQQRSALKQFVGNLKPNGGTGKMLVKSGYGTGKTWLAAFVGLWFVCVFDDAIVLFMSSSGPHVKQKLFAEFRRMYSKSRVRLGGELLSSTLRFGDKWSATAVSPANPDNFQGSHERNLLVVFDEAQAIKPEFWNAAEGMMQGDNAATLAIFNPLYTDCAAAECWKKPVEWARRTFSSLEHDNIIQDRSVFPGAVTREWIEARRKQWGEGSSLYRTRVLGEFPLTSENSVLSIFDLENAVRSWNVERQREFMGIEGLWIGVDLARFGSDFSVLTVVKDRRVIAQRSWSMCDTMQSVGNITIAVEQFGVPWNHVNIDADGLGAGVYDRLIELNHPVNDIINGGSPQGDWDSLDICAGLKFLNRRAELFWVVRCLLREESACIPTRFSQGWADLTAMRYKTHSTGKIQLEAKDDFKKRMARSPDFGDSIAYAFSRSCSDPEVAWAR